MDLNQALMHAQNMKNFFRAFNHIEEVLLVAAQASNLQNERLHKNSELAQEITTKEAKLASLSDALELRIQEVDRLHAEALRNYEAEAAGLRHSQAELQAAMHAEKAKADAMRKDIEARLDAARAAAAAEHSKLQSENEALRQATAQLRKELHALKERLPV